MKNISQINKIETFFEPDKCYLHQQINVLNFIRVQNIQFVFGILQNLGNFIQNENGIKLEFNFCE